MGCCVSKSLKKSDGSNLDSNEDDVYIHVNISDKRTKSLNSLSNDEIKIRSTKMRTENSFFKAKQISKDKHNSSLQTSEDEQITNNMILLNDSIQNFKTYSLDNNALAQNPKDKNTPPNKNTSSDDVQLLKISEIQNISCNINISNRIFDIAEQELEKEALIFEENNFTTNLNKLKNKEDPSSNYSSNSLKLMSNNSNGNAYNSNNSNFYVDKNNQNLKISKKGTESDSRLSDNYDSNFTFNNVPNRINNGSNENNTNNIENSPNKKRLNLNQSYSNTNIINNSSNSFKLEELKKHNQSTAKGNRESHTNLANENFLIGSNTTEENPAAQNFFVNNYFSKKTYSFILFEINNFCFTQKEYFKNIYPEINLVMILEINDCILSQEKIFFFHSDDMTNNIYYPYIKKEDMKFNRYRIIKPIEINDEEFPIKISISFYSFTNFKLLLIGSEEIFLTLRKERELQKFNFYHNIHIKYTNKKIGNLCFNLAYKIDELYPHQLLDEIGCSLNCLTNLQTLRKFDDEDLNLIFVYYSLIDNLDNKISLNEGEESCNEKSTEKLNVDNIIEGDNNKDKAKEKEKLPINSHINNFDSNFSSSNKHNNINANYSSNPLGFEKSNLNKLKNNLSSANIDLKRIITMNHSMKENNFDLKNYFSIEEINKIEISQELKKSEINIDRVLELINMELTNQEYYTLFKRVNQNLVMSEFTLEKMNIFKNKLISILRNYIDSSNPSDILTLPIIFYVLKRSFYKLKKENLSMLKQYNSSASSIDSNKRSLNSTSATSASVASAALAVKQAQMQFKYKDETEKKNHIRNGELLLESIKIACNFLDFNLHEDISLSALNYIYKFFEEPIHFEYEEKINVTDNFLMDVILHNKIYILICEMIMKLNEFQACVHPCLDVIFRLIKNKKSESKDLIKIILSDNFMTVIYIIIRTHECNMKIMINIFSIICLLNDKFDPENFCYLFSFQKLREIFNIYKANGFQMIHEIIIHLVRNLVNKKQEYHKKFCTGNTNTLENIVTNNTDSETINTIKLNNSNRVNNSRSSLSSHGNVSNSVFLKDDEVLEIFLIFLNSIQWMKAKISTIHDLKKSSRYIFNIINNIFIICNVIVIILENIPQKVQVLNHFRLTDCIISIILLIRDIQFYRDIDEIQGSQDMTSLGNKVLVLKKIFFCNKIIKMILLKIPNYKDNVNYKSFQSFMACFFSEKAFQPTSISQALNALLGPGTNSKDDKASEQIKKSFAHVDFMYKELKSDY